MQNFIKGVLGSFGLHLIFGLLAFGLVFLFTQEFGNASENLLLELADADDQEAQVLAYLAASREQLAGWIWPVMMTSFLSSLVFIGLAQQSMPSTTPEMASKKGLWVFLFFLCLIMAANMWFWRLSGSSAAHALVFTNYTLILFATSVLMMLSYWLSTALFVKSTMVPSVPVAPLLRGK